MSLSTKRQCKICQRSLFTNEELFGVICFTDHYHYLARKALARLQAAAAGGFDSAGLGPAAESGKATYSLKSFRGLLEIV